MVAHPADGFVAAFTGANLLHGIARPGEDGLTEIVLESGETIFSADAGAGRIEAVVYPWEISVSTESTAGFGAERDPRARSARSSTSGIASGSASGRSPRR